MTTKPELQTEKSFLAGLAAIALFVVLGAVFMGVSFPAPAGFGEGASVTKSLGAAMFDISPSAIMGEGESAVPSEGFLIALETIDIVLVAALVGAVMLARREDAGEIVSLGFGTTEDEQQTVAADGGGRTAPSDETGGDDA